jgi:hypothetical protein
MNGKIKIKPSIEDYDNGAQDKPETIEIGLIDLGEMINQKLENRPLDRDRNLLKEWKRELNLMIESYNSRVGWKCFSHVY